MPTIDMFRDSIWQFLGVVATIIGIGIAVVLYQKQRNRKEFSYYVLAEIPVVAPNKKFAQRIKVLFDDLEVARVHLIAIRLENTGNVGIRREDYDKQVAISFPGSGPILEVSVSRTEPHGIDVTLHYDSDSAGLEPFLFNKEWRIELTCLVSNYRGRMSVTGTIADVYEIKRKSFDEGSSVDIFAPLGVLLGMLVVLSAAYFNSFFVLAVGVVLAIPFLFVMATRYYERERKRRYDG